MTRDDWEHQGKLGVTRHDKGWLDMTRMTIDD